MRGLPGAYKLFWDYLYHDCDHAGIWIVDFEVAQLYIGHDMIIDKKKALHLFNVGEIRIIELDNESKWFIVPFIEFQYGELSEVNRAHNSVIGILKKYNLLKKLKAPYKPLLAPSEGAMDKEMDKDLILIRKIEKKGNLISPKFLDSFLMWLKYKRNRSESYKDEDSAFLAYKKLIRFSKEDPNFATKIIEQSMENNWAGIFEIKPEKSFSRQNNSSEDDYEHDAPIADQFIKQHEARTK